jgi:hypothetical protein
MAVPAYNLNVVQTTLQSGTLAGNPLKAKVSFR